MAKKKTDEQLYAEQCEDYLAGLKTTGACQENGVRECRLIMTHCEKLITNYRERIAIEKKCIAIFKSDLKKNTARIALAKRQIAKAKKAIA